MEPVVSALAIAAAKRAGPVVWRSFRLAGTADTEWLVHGVGAEYLSTGDVADIRLFLDSDDAKALLSTLAVIQLMADGEARNDLDALVAQRFSDSAKRWIVQSKGQWKSRALWLYTSIRASMQQTLPTSARVGDELRKRAEAFASPIRIPFDVGTTNRTTQSLYVDRLSALAANFEALAAVSRLLTELTASIAEAPRTSILTHTPTDMDLRTSDLYIARTVYDRERQAHSVLNLLQDAGGCRMVVTGNPGAGKSTLVSRLAPDLAASQLNTPQASLVIRCRDYISNSAMMGISDYLAETLSRDWNIKTDRQLVDNTLLTGRMVIIFDGIDEALDIDRRLSLVQLIERFAQQFPTTSIVVTSRTEGYRQAALTSSLFEHLTLEDFSEPQVEEYARLWFEAAEAPVLASYFLEESEAVADLRSNPLSLSLLCILYKAEGEIPRRRHEIYRECAQLLFKRWDAHRRIHYPDTSPAYEPRLLAEVGLFFYKQPNLQGGASERVLAKTMAMYLKDAIGIDEDEAIDRARYFLEYCSGRAWLLDVISHSKTGERQFGFVHRTFYEYFAAEGWARNAADAKEVAGILRMSYGEDRTSVLPELLIQAYDDRVERGASLVYRELCTGANQAGLLLRLMKGSILPKHSRAEAFNVLLREWLTSGTLTLDAAEGINGLTDVALTQFVRDFINAAAETVQYTRADGLREGLISATRLSRSYSPLALAIDLLSRARHRRPLSSVSWTLSHLRTNTERWLRGQALSSVTVRHCI